MSVRRVLGKKVCKPLAGVVALAALVLAIPGYRLTLHGWLRCEPCYDWKPVSYWRRQLNDWRIDEPDVGTVNESRGGHAERGREKFICVIGARPGKWCLQQRETPAQQVKTKLRGIMDRLAGHGTCLNPTYGEPFCKLALVEGDPAAVPVLLGLLKDEDVGIRRHAAAALGTIGPPARAAFPALLETADHDDDAFLRGIARTALLDIDMEAAAKAGVVDHFIFSSPQPRLLATIQCSLVLDAPTAFLASGKIPAWDDKAGTVTLHDVATGKVLATCPGPANSAAPIAFSHDGRTVASGSKDKTTVKVWHLATGRDVATLRGHTGAVESLAFSPDGKTLASGSSDRTVKLWAVGNGQNTATLRGHTASVSAVAFSPDGRTLASGQSYSSCTVKLWDVSTGKERATCRHDPNWGSVECLAFSPDGKTLASGSRESSVMLVDVASGKERATLDEGEESGSLDSVSFSPDGRTLAYVSWDKIFLCDVATGKTRVKILAEPGRVDGAVFTPDGRMLAVSRGRDGHSGRLWEFGANPSTEDSRRGYFGLSPGPR